MKILMKRLKNKEVMMIKKLLAFSIIFCALASVSYGAAGEPERGYISLHGSASREVSPNIATLIKMLKLQLLITTRSLLPL